MNIKDYLEGYRDYLIDRTYLDSDTNNSRTSKLVQDKHTENIVDEITTSLNVLLDAKRTSLDELNSIFDNLYDKVDYLTLNANNLAKLNKSELLPNRLEGFKILKPLNIKNYNKLLGGIALPQKSNYMYVSTSNSTRIDTVNTDTFYVLKNVVSDVYELILDESYLLKEVLFYDKKNQLIASTTKNIGYIPTNCAKIISKSTSDSVNNPTTLNIYSFQYTSQANIQLNKNTLDIAKYLTINTDSFIPNSCSGTIEILGKYIRNNKVVDSFSLKLGVNSVYSTCLGSEIVDRSLDIYNLNDELVTSNLSNNTIYKIINNGIGCEYLGNNTFELQDLGCDSIEFTTSLRLITTNEAETPLITSIIAYTHND